MVSVGSIAEGFVYRGQQKMRDIISRIQTNGLLQMSHRFPGSPEADQGASRADMRFLEVGLISGGLREVFEGLLKFSSLTPDLADLIFCIRVFGSDGELLLKLAQSIFNGSLFF